ncbi:hypothetical protein AB0H42_09785 [Nocardia sp. NPDC050799]|uniref:hypothetical protein n=1 Tax=Nocardia sp. NPDC050799 TaxID=3154842 RepID=UPI0033D3BC3B
MTRCVSRCSRKSLPTAAAFLHQITNQLVKTHDRLVVEDLHVAGMLRNRRLARSIADTGWADFGRLLDYKQRWRSGTVVTADRWFPSSTGKTHHNHRTSEQGAGLPMPADGKALTGTR